MVEVLLRARIVDSCPPCVVIEEVKAVATLSARLALLPEPSRLIHELLQLCRHVAEPRLSAESDADRPLQVLEVRDRLVLDLLAMPAPVLVLRDDQPRSELLDVADTHFSPLPSCSLGERVREPVNVAGRAVVGDGDAGRSRYCIASTSSGTALKSIRRWLPSRHGVYAHAPQRKRATHVGQSKRRRPWGTVPDPGPFGSARENPIRAWKVAGVRCS